MSVLELAGALGEPALVGGLESVAGESLLEGASRYLGASSGAGLAWRVEPGSLPAGGWLTADLLVDGRDLVTMALRLQEGEDGPAFDLVFNLLTQCQARLRMPLSAGDQGVWKFPREGAWMKPRCRGDRVDLSRVDRVRLTIDRMGDRAVRFCVTPMQLAAAPPAKVDRPLLPKGKLLDELGQSTLHAWPGKSRGVEEVTARLRSQLAEAPGQRWPGSFGRWGGDASGTGEATGYFRREHDGRRWWLIDPAGQRFFSSGLCCIRRDVTTAYSGLEDALSWLPPRGGEYGAAYGGKYADIAEFSYLGANLIRAFGAAWYERWSVVALSMLRRFGFNTVGNFSDWRVPAAAGFPYVRMVGFAFEETPRVFRDLPDVFDARFGPEVERQAATLAETAGDPALVGYFLMNEPRWGFASECPAEGMLFHAEAGAAREALARFVHERHGERLAEAWGAGVTAERVARGRWSGRVTAAARRDLEDFSGVMLGRFFGALSAACRRVDPNHLNLGVRFQVTPPAYALSAMKNFDVFSMNCYKERVPRDTLERVARELGAPTVVGEWHFGALDVGLPGSGIGRVATQADRGRAFRVYLEDAASNPWCVGVHYFTLYDQSALGRFDGENYQIGFLDVCHRAYEPLAEAARRSHEAMYAVARGEAEAYADAPAYLSKLF